MLPSYVNLLCKGLLPGVVGCMLLEDKINLENVEVEAENYIEISQPLYFI